ncbi:M20/M25/M40 family metallo-hydrolase [Niabella sp. CC-SYL272]|uniref:M20/M25/M40 family metallo-hydrolase n=1 Tax=Niabella agricola TaxID=2891571 RepID=UPI001F278707|nr:M20/M25/M40 family metallo-hydrolase [Niabella agricola]MCF3108718.1 M20/M25/M40 family metallo-hydrolase [Niabella agricola]
MKKYIMALLVTALVPLALHAQLLIHKDPAIEKMVAAVSADSLRSCINALAGFKTRHTLSTQKDPAGGIGAAQQWVLHKFRQFAAASGERLSAFIDTVTYRPDGKRVDRPFVLGNVMGILKGTDPLDRRILMITGHLDSRRSDVMDRAGIAPGANDDGSGVAALLECARIMSRQPPPVTVVFVATSGEEQGLLGARFLADQVTTKNWQLEALLNNDIIGSNHSNETRIVNNTQVRVFSEGLPLNANRDDLLKIRSLGLENDGAPRQLARYFKETGERYIDHMTVKLVYRNDRFLRNGDQSPFVEKGYTAVRITEMNENFEHQHQDLRTERAVPYGDLPEFMDFEYLRKNTALNLATLTNLAKAPSVPQNVVYITRGLENSTTIKWNPPATGACAGYYLLMRETSSPQWEKKIFTAATTITVPYSKDNYFFAVQSVSAAGNESLPALPGLPGNAYKKAVPNFSPIDSPSRMILIQLSLITRRMLFYIRAYDLGQVEHRHL